MTRPIGSELSCRDVYKLIVLSLCGGGWGCGVGVGVWGAGGGGEK